MRVSEEPKSPGASLESRWYSGPRPPAWTRPLEWLFRFLSGLRRRLYRMGWLRSVNPGCPVIVVGNITVGGTGKTPFVIWLVRRLREAGLKVAVVSRGYGGEASRDGASVDADDLPTRVGDEPLLIAREAGVPVRVGADRVVAATRLVEEHAPDVIVSDDGLQHYRLRRSLEIVIMDGERWTGNGHMLPAGPLREPAARLATADLVVVNGGRRALEAGQYPMKLRLGEAVNLETGERRALETFRDHPIHAVAGIGNPARFFAQLRDEFGLDVIEHPFADHAHYSAEDLDFGDGRPVLMTSKDAVKCMAWAGPAFWQVPARAEVAPEVWQRIGQVLARRVGGVIATRLETT
ncbi:MAG: tetraacyldisaccharide 4'-kinase [Gammaproteobacteria bacterium]|jgi:tetraacyldisaccharide 4'-kinase